MKNMTINTNMSIQHHRYVFAITMTISLLVYLRTLSPSIAGGDSGELVAEGCQLGTSHPPGYPLYTILVYLATNIGRYFMPDGGKSPAFFVNLTSALFGSVASGLLSSCTLYMIQINESRDDALQNHVARHKQNIESKKKKKKSKKKPVDQQKGVGDVDIDKSSISQKELSDESTMINMYIAVFVGLLHSFSPLVWQYSVTAEVFALHNLFVGLIVHTTLRFGISGQKKLLFLGAFLCGLAMTNQHISVLLLIPLISWVLYVTKLYWPIQDRKNECATNEKRKGKKVPLLLQIALYFLSGFAFLYGTMPLLSLMSPHAGSWGDVTSISGFIHHFTRKDYGSLRLYSGNDNGSENVWERIFLWGKDLMWSQTHHIVGVTTIIACNNIINGEIRKRRASNKQEIKKGDNGSTQGVIVISNEDHIEVDTAILCSLLFYLFVFHILANLPLSNPLFFGIHQRFWMHPNYLCFVLSGIGLKKLCKKFTQNSAARMRFCQCALVFIVAYVYHIGFIKSDQSNNLYFRNYATSILETLPHKSVLFINYDQQWTSIRYMQECEGVRKDITSINLSMMSYEWWSKKHELYPNIQFPGSHYSYQKGGFTFAQLLDANHLFDGRAFIGGNLVHKDDSYARRYDEIPHGIVRRIIRKGSDKDNTTESYRKESSKIWQVIAREHAKGLPSLSKYGQDTWEWTIRREFFEHFVSRAAHLLDLALSSSSSDSDDKKIDHSELKSIVEASAWLEAARLNDDISNDSPAIWKNLGLAYMNIVRNDEITFPSVKDLFKGTENSFLFENVKKEVWWDENNTKDWKAWASIRWQRSWGRFLEIPSAKDDQSYEKVKDIYDLVLDSIKKKEYNGR